MTLMSRSILAAAGVCAVVTACAAQPVEPPPLDAAARTAIVDGVSAGLEETYIFADVADKMEQHVRGRLAAGAYDGLSSPVEFCATLTEDLQSISHDRHLRVRYEPSPPEDQQPPSDEEREAAMIANMRRQNFCFERIERLPGNIGLLKFNCFAPAEAAGATAVAAMNFVANSDALIFDLRDNGGGSPSMIQLISSYLFEESTHLNSFYIRKSDETKQFWTQAHVDGPTMTDVPVWVLTSRRTFSGAEEFTYNLKNLERGTIVGETTGGGAHPVERYDIEGTNVVMSLPFGRAVNPITGTNWEGTGVEPHIKVPAEQALTTAHMEALKGLEAAAGDDDARSRLAWVREGLAVLLESVSMTEAELRAYVGTYGPRTITLEDGRLHYQRTDRAKYPLIPMGSDRFLIEEVPYFRLLFERDDAGAVVRVVGQYDNGTRDMNERSGGAGVRE